MDLPEFAVAVVIRRTPHARRMTLRIPLGHSEPVLTIPARASLEEAARFLEAHESWLRRQLGRRAPAVPFAPGALIPLRGVPHRIRHRPAVAGAHWTGLEAGEPVLCVTGRPEHVHRRVADALRRFAREDLQAAVARAAAGIDRRPKAVKIRDTRSQWGSCTASGVLSFSWRLVMAPPLVLDYVAAHEVAHLVEHDHGRAFWRLTRQLCPRMEEARRWLKAHGPSLHCYGAGSACGSDANQPHARAAAPASLLQTGERQSWELPHSSTSSCRSSALSSSAISRS